MRQTYFITALLILSFISCRKGANTDAISGLYTETNPVPGRSQLNFISGSYVVKGEPGSSYKDTFKYSISAGKILLTPTWTAQYPGQQFDFEKIDENTIKIENLYPTMPGATKSYMMFRK